jgi:hypothetical protein
MFPCLCSQPYEKDKSLFESDRFPVDIDWQYEKLRDVRYHRWKAKGDYILTNKHRIEEGPPLTPN